MLYSPMEKDIKFIRPIAANTPVRPVWGLCRSSSEKRDCIKVETVYENVQKNSLKDFFQKRGFY